MSGAFGPVPSSGAVVPKQGDVIPLGAFGSLDTFLVVRAGVWGATGL